MIVRYDTSFQAAITILVRNSSINRHSLQSVDFISLRKFSGIFNFLRILIFVDFCKIHFSFRSNSKALHLHRHRKGFPRASFCPIKYCPQMLMNKQCRESNCFNKHARQVEGHYFYVDNPKPISYHFQLVCQILRKKKDKMREIFSRIK